MVTSLSWGQVKIDMRFAIAMEGEVLSREYRNLKFGTNSVAIKTIELK